MGEKGTVYVLKNELFKGLLKIGHTTRSAEERAGDFNSGLPQPWEVVCAVDLEKYKELEKVLHNLFDTRRYSKKREFFYFSSEYEKDIKELFGILKGEDVTDKIASDISDADTEYMAKKEGIYELLVDGGEYTLKVKDGVLKATYSKKDNKFTFDRDLKVTEPSFKDSHGSAIKSAKNLYNYFCKDKVIENGTFKLKGRSVYLKQMSRHTIVALNKSANWLNQWKDKNENPIKPVKKS
jgi:hypothetical protein